MEFGIFVMMNIMGERAHDPAAEHSTLKEELELIRLADRTGWKYVWVTEHHCLPEYSHLSANESFIPYALAITERIHVGSGIFNINPIANHPLRLAERVAMLDLLSDGRFEFGTGRGAGLVGGGDLQPQDLRDQGGLGRGHLGVQEDVGVAELLLRRQVLPGARAQRAPEAIRRRDDASADVGGGRQPAHLREGGPPRHGRPRLQRGDGPRHEGPGRRLQGRHPGGHAGRPVRERQRDDQQLHAVPRRRPARPPGLRRQHDVVLLLAAVPVPRHVPGARGRRALARARYPSPASTASRR